MIDTSCGCTKVRRAARALTQMYDEAVAPAGVKITQFSLLRSLQRVGDVHISGLAAATGLERSTLGRNIRLLEKAGLVRLIGGGDARERKIVLTRGGEDTLAAATPLWLGVQSRLADGLGEARLDALFALLDELSRMADGRRLAAKPSREGKA